MGEGNSWWGPSAGADVCPTNVLVGVFISLLSASSSLPAHAYTAYVCLCVLCGVQQKSSSDLGIFENILHFEQIHSLTDHYCCLS